MMKTEQLVCDECDTQIGYVIYQRWIDFDMCLCCGCMEKRLLKGTYLEERNENRMG